MIYGHTQPRLCTEPLRRLTHTTSRGHEVVAFARDVLGMELLPWQAEVATRGLELNPDGSFRFRTVLCLVGRQNGKSHLLRVVALWRLYVDGARMVLGVGQDTSLAREGWGEAIATIRSRPELAAELDTVRHTTGDEWFRLASGGRYKISAANRAAGRGLSVDQLIMDEIREQRSWDAWSALSKTTMARSSGQTWAISTAGDDESIVLNHLRDAALSNRDPSIGLFEWSAEEGCDLDDPAAWQASNPGLGYTVSEAAIRSALGTDPAPVFRTEVLCQKVDALDSPVDLGAWAACSDPSGSLASADRIIACLDVAPDGQHVSLVGAGLLPSGWVRLEVLAAWADTGKARAELPDVLGKAAPAAVGWFPTGPAAALGAEMRDREATEIKGAEVAESCMEFSDLVSARRVLHPSDPLLDAHLAAASKYHSGDGWRFARKGGGHVDAAYAAAGAAHLARTLPVAMPRPRSAVF